MMRLQRGNHVCCVHDQRSAQVSFAAAFVREGLGRNHRCLVTDSETGFGRLMEQIPKEGWNGQRERSALRVLDKRDSFLRGGRFVPRVFLDRLGGAEAEALNEGFTGLRVVVEMAWLLGAHDSLDTVIEYETLLQQWLPESRSIVLCQYHRPSLETNRIRVALCAHETIVVDDRPCRNPYQEPPDLLLQEDFKHGGDVEAKRLDWRLERLRTAPASESSSAGGDAETLYRRLIETIPHTVWMTQPDGSTDFINQKGVEYFGFPAETLYGWGWLDMLHPDFVERSRQLWEASVRDGTPYRNEYRLRGADGVYRWVLSQGVPIRRPDGSVERWVGTWTDIEDLKRAEENSARRALLLANVRDAVVVTDLEGVVTYWNEGATRLFGWTADEAVGRPLAERFPESFRPSVEEMTRDFANGVEWSREWLDYRKDGSRVWIAVRVARIEDADGNPLGIMSVSHDIDARKRAEADLLLRDRAIQAVTQGILITDATSPEHAIIYASPGFERLTQYKRDDVIGIGCGFLWGRDTDPAAMALLVDAARECRPDTVELLSYRRDGTPFWNEVSVSPVIDDDGQLTHFVCIHNDVTARRRLEEQYRQAQKMEAIGLLGGGVAHDFNNLLTVITGYTELVLRSLPADDPKREMLDEIKKAGERSAALTRQLLAFSRRQVLAPRTIDLNDVVRDTEKMLRRVIGEDIELKTVLQPALGRVRGDPGQLEQVLLNLAVNARDAMPHGGSLTLETRNVELDEIFVALYPSVRPGPYVMLVVSDSGVGMAAEVKQRIFEPFFTTKGPGEGTGLGAAVVHGIIQQSGGHVQVESEPGRGAEFRIYLPMVDPKRPLSSTVGDATETSSGGGETILLAEDDAGVRALSLQILRDGGYEVLEAQDGEDALRIEAEHAGPIHLLMTDVVMPGMGGRELSEKLLRRRPDIKILFLSGYTDDAVVRYGVLQEKVNFLQKPFAPDVLARKVREALAT